MRTALLLLGLGGLAGCTPAPPPPAPPAPRPAPVPAGGTVTVDGRPAAGASLLFFPAPYQPNARGAAVPSATVGADGRFALSTFGTADGAPPGQYVVAVTWNVPRPGQRPKGGYDGPEDDRLGGRYSDPQTTRLTADVAPAGPNGFDFRLEERPPADKPATATPPTPR